MCMYIYIYMHMCVLYIFTLSTSETHDVGSFEDLRDADKPHSTALWSTLNRFNLAVAQFQQIAPRHTSEGLQA